jgi:hypothetical protein
MEPIKPGTRCECGRDMARECCLNVEKTDTGRRESIRCMRDAVRMVTVRHLPAEQRIAAILEHGDAIPMCKPCATFHERRGR